jgi:hypothetical protein
MFLKFRCISSKFLILTSDRHCITPRICIGRTVKILNLDISHVQWALIIHLLWLMFLEINCFGTIDITPIKHLTGTITPSSILLSSVWTLINFTIWTCSILKIFRVTRARQVDVNLFSNTVIKWTRWGWLLS